MSINSCFDRYQQHYNHGEDRQDEEQDRLHVQSPSLSSSSRCSSSRCFSPTKVWDELQEKMTLQSRDRWDDEELEGLNTQSNYYSFDNYFFNNSEATSDPTANFDDVGERVDAWYEDEPPLPIDEDHLNSMTLSPRTEEGDQQQSRSLCHLFETEKVLPPEDAAISGATILEMMRSTEHSALHQQQQQHQRHTLESHQEGLQIDSAPAAQLAQGGQISLDEPVNNAKKQTSESERKKVEKVDEAKDREESSPSFSSSDSSSMSTPHLPQVLPAWKTRAKRVMNSTVDLTSQGISSLHPVSAASKIDAYQVHESVNIEVQKVEDSSIDQQKLQHHQSVSSPTAQISKHHGQLLDVYPTLPRHLHELLKHLTPLPSIITKIIIKQTGVLEDSELSAWCRIPNTRHQAALMESPYFFTAKSQEMMDVLTIQAESINSASFFWERKIDTIKLQFYDGQLEAIDLLDVNEKMKEQTGSEAKTQREKQQQFSFSFVNPKILHELNAQIQIEEEKHENEHNFVLCLGVSWERTPRGERRWQRHLSCSSLFYGGLFRSASQMLPLCRAHEEAESRSFFQTCWHSNIQCADSPERTSDLIASLLSRTSSDGIQEQHGHDRVYRYYRVTSTSIQFVGEHAAFSIVKLKSHRRELEGEGGFVKSYVQLDALKTCWKTELHSKMTTSTSYN